MESYQAQEVWKGGLRGVLREHSSLWDLGKGHRKLHQALCLFSCPWVSFIEITRAWLGDSQGGLTPSWMFQDQLPRNWGKQADVGRIVR